MLDHRIITLLTVCEQGSFTAAAEALSLTQPAVSHHIRQLEEDWGIRIFHRKRGTLLPTESGKIAIKYARRAAAMNDNFRRELADASRNITSLRVGITQTAESGVAAQVLAKYSADHEGVNIMIFTETINNLYTMLTDYQIDLAIVDARVNDPGIHSVMLDTDYLVCVMSNNNPLAKRSMVTLDDLKRERMILRLPDSDTRNLFVSNLESLGLDIEDFDVMLEVDNIATIKDLVRKDMGVSILARSACMNELRKGKLTVLPIENLSMVRETNLLYLRDFEHTDILRDLTKLYGEMTRLYQ